MCFGEDTGFTLHTSARQTKVSSYKVKAESEELIVTFAQGIIDIGINENYRKTPE